jgi:uncharacterized protein (DUF924 family)
VKQHQDLLDFWFGVPGSADYGRPRPFWFQSDRTCDETLRSRFFSHYEAARAGELQAWQEEPLSCLALILLLDQIPRSLFRGTAQAFATDAEALKIAQQTVEWGFDRALLPVQRWFIYLPLEHSENLEHQNRAVALFQQLQDDPHSQGAIVYAQQHQAIIARFGRFPHRNTILGRHSTAEELAFLQEPGSSF